MRNATFRVGVWAAAGLLIAMAWGLYFATANKTIPIGPLVYVMARLTQPVVALIVSYLTPDVGLREAAAANAATYAIVGIVVETVRKQLIGPNSVGQLFWG
jgi:hypothetical protein